MSESLSRARPPRADLDVGRLVLSGPKRRGKNMSAQIQDAVTGSTIETTMDGASTLTLVISDWSRKLQNSSLLQGPVQLTFDSETYVLSKVQKQGTTLTLTFEDRAVNVLRQYTKPRKADRANTTRAQFVRSMVREVREVTVPFVCPEVNKRQPIARPKVVIRTRTQRAWLH